MTALLLAPLYPKPAPWRDWFAAEIPDLDVRIWPDTGDRAAIDVVAVGRMPHGELKSFPNLKLIISLLAGSERLLADPSLPEDVPIVRAGDPDGDAMMNETTLLHVLRHHRNLPDYLLAQARSEWLSLPIPRVSERRVGVMGLGPIGLATARMLADYGFQVAAWARRPRVLDGIEVFAGQPQLGAFLARSEIVVNLLPLTPETENILGHATFAQLPKGASIINLGRGAHVADADLMAALDSGQLAGATLDVFRTEPLPGDSPLWRHPRITIIPHASRRIDARDLVPRICAAVRRLRAGQAPEQLVDRKLGY
jgi:glyoxylate/hydroxypyruvate reductase A